MNTDYVVLLQKRRTVSKYLDKAIRYVARKYYWRRIWIEIEYEDVIDFIAKELFGGNKNYNSNQAEEVLKEIVENRVDKLLVSYLLSKYIEKKKQR